MMSRITGARKINHKRDSYAGFDKLDGHHPWADAVPEGCVHYRARILPNGKVAYFNFYLAKEMGLIESSHSHVMTAELEQKIIQTFSLQIINEFDELSMKKIDSALIKPHKFMATRYLQLQHSNRQGKTSGDGRGIWNGVVQHKNTIWDVSSRGTGVTCLAPGSAQANRPLKTGDTDFGYGCGQAEIDELYAAAIFAERVHLQGVHTERVLCIVDLGRGVGIGVRAAPNLLRPAHLFLYLKQGRHKELRAAVDYFIDRQVKNKAWTLNSVVEGQKYSPAVYNEVLDKICIDFATFSAKLDTDYIFAWLDWDGDNVLANAGIIDYGSVRQFGIRHDNYRYDDVERFSTNLNEQRHKARLIVQAFCQMFDFVKTANKKPLKDFSQHHTVNEFNRHFPEQRSDRLLYRAGFSVQQREIILKHNASLFAQFDKIYSYFEKAKISGSPQKVPDGVNHPALYNMRQTFKFLPQLYLQSKQKFQDTLIDEKEFFKSIISGFAKSRDTKIRAKHIEKIRELQRCYKELILAVAEKTDIRLVLRGIDERSQKLNIETRMTGNALIQIVNILVAEQKLGLPREQIQKTIDRLIFECIGLPEVKISRHYRQLLEAPFVRLDFYQRIHQILVTHNEDI